MTRTHIIPTEREFSESADESERATFGHGHFVAPGVIVQFRGFFHAAGYGIGGWGRTGAGLIDLPDATEGPLVSGPISYPYEHTAGRDVAFELGEADRAGKLFTVHMGDFLMIAGERYIVGKSDGKPTLTYAPTPWTALVPAAFKAIGIASAMGHEGNFPFGAGRTIEAAVATASDAWRLPRSLIIGMVKTGALEYVAVSPAWAIAAREIRADGEGKLFPIPTEVDFHGEPVFVHPDENDLFIAGDPQNDNELFSEELAEWKYADQYQQLTEALECTGLTLCVDQDWSSYAWRICNEVGQPGRHTILINEDAGNFTFSILRHVLDADGDPAVEDVHEGWLDFEQLADMALQIASREQSGETSLDTLIQVIDAEKLNVCDIIDSAEWPRFDNVTAFFDECIAVNKYADPIEDEARGISLETAEEVYAFTPALLWVSYRDMAAYAERTNEG